MSPQIAVKSDPRKKSREVIYGPIVLDICAAAIDQFYMSPIRPTIQNTIYHAQIRVSDEQLRLDAEYEKNSAISPERIILKAPTRYLIRHLIEEIPEFDRYAARFGHRAATVKFRTWGNRHMENKEHCQCSKLPDSEES